MSEPFLAEIRMVGFNFPPKGWAQCDGQILPINQNQSLYSLLGTLYGGDGRTSFALPDLRGRTPIHIGNGHSQGQKSGVELVQLTAAEMPQHKHAVQASADNATSVTPAGLAYANAKEVAYATYSAAQKAALATGILPNAGASQGHQNMQPYLALNFCIAIQGLFPSRN